MTRREAVTFYACLVFLGLMLMFGVALLFGGGG